MNLWVIQKMIGLDRKCVRHLREEGGDGDALALVDVVEAGTEALHDGG